MVPKQEINVVFSCRRHMTPAIPFVYEVLSLLVVAFDIISIIFAGGSVEHYHSLPLILLLPLLMLRRTHFVVNGDANLSVFVVPFILAYATVEMFPTLVTPSCYITIVNFHTYIGHTILLYNYRQFS